MRRGIRIAQWLLAATVVGSALAVGAIHTVVLLCVVVVLGAAALFAWWNASAVRPRTSATLLLAVAVGLTAYTAFQLVPLPAGLLAAIAPGTADVWSRALAPLHEPGPAWAPLTLDPAATRVEVARGVAYLLAFLVTLRLAHRSEGAAFCARMLAASCLIVGIAATLHPAFGAEKVFGIYRPETDIPARHIAPILNANALSAYLNVGICVALGMTIARRPIVPRALSGAVVVVLVAIVLWVASRAGVLTMALGIGLVLWGSRVTRREHSRATGAALFGGVVLAACAVFVLAGSEQAWGELATKDTTKLAVFAEIVPMVKAFAAFGAGRGAFESVFPAFRTGNVYYVFTHPENVLLQWSSEWGVVVAALGIVGIGWALRPRVLFARGDAAVGAWAAIVVVGVHNLVDFSSEFPGVVIALSVCAGIVVAGSASTPTEEARKTVVSRIQRWGRVPRATAWALGGASAAGAALAAASLGKSLYDDRFEAHDLAAAETPKEEFAAQVRPMLLRHPSEPYLPYAGAARAWKMRDESPVPWAARALERAPVYGPAHLILARTLARGRLYAQARLEYRFAAEQAPEYLDVALREGLHLVHGYDDAWELVPTDGDRRAPALDGLSSALSARLPSTAWRLDDELLHVAPASVGALERRARSEAGDLRHDARASWCEPPPPDALATCLKAARESATRLEAAAPTTCEGFFMESQVLVESGDVDGALKVLEQAADQVENRSECMQHAVAVAQMSGNDGRVTAAVDRLVRTGCGTADECVGNLSYAAQVELARGNRARALTFYEKAYERYPERDDALASAAQVASSMELHARAADSYAKLASRHPDDAQWKTALASERAALIAVPTAPGAANP